MNRYCFSIAGMKILLEYDGEMLLHDDLIAFLTEFNNSESDIRCVVIEDLSAVDEIKANGKIIYREENVVFYEYQNFTYRFVQNFDEICYTKFDKNDLTRFEIYAEKYNGKIVVRITDLICLDIAWINFNAFRLHSSFVKYNGRAVIFSAPCQTGKSTQARLWEEYRGAKIINGDKTILRKIDGEWMAFGSPWAGSSRLFINESAERPAVAIIRQSKQNRIVELSKSQAIRLILSQTQNVFWNTEQTDKICCLVEDFVSSNSVFMLECRPDEEATEIVDKWLLNYGQ